VSQERVTAFTDAAVAIALTLLVLPLVETARDSRNIPLHTLVHEHGGDFLAFIVSFLVIGRFWRVHRRLFEVLTHLDEGLTVLNLAWLFGIVFLPVPTALLVGAKSSTYGGTAVYAVNLLFIGLTALAMTIWVALHPDLWESDAQAPFLRAAVWRGAAACVVIAVVVPAGLWLGPWALLLLLLLPVSQRLSGLLTRPRAAA
jgi:uncharacterized membrane protein